MRPLVHATRATAWRGGHVSAADTLYPWDFDLLRRGIVEILPVGHFARTQRVDQHVGLPGVHVILRFHPHTFRKLPDLDRNYDRRISFESLVHKKQRAADSE